MYQTLYILAMFTESTCVPRALFLLAFRINVKIHTLIAVAAFAIFRVEPALWHLFHVEHV